MLIFRTLTHSVFEIASGIVSALATASPVLFQSIAGDRTLSTLITYRDGRNFTITEGNLDKQALTLTFHEWQKPYPPGYEFPLPNDRGGIRFLVTSFHTIEL